MKKKISFNFELFIILKTFLSSSITNCISMLICLLTAMESKGKFWLWLLANTSIISS
jgi:hypothetical protein